MTRLVALSVVLVAMLVSSATAQSLPETLSYIEDKYREDGAILCSSYLRHYGRTFRFNSDNGAIAFSYECRSNNCAQRSICSYDVRSSVISRGEVCEVVFGSAFHWTVGIGNDRKRLTFPGVELVPCDGYSARGYRLGGTMERSQDHNWSDPVPTRFIMGFRNEDAARRVVSAFRHFFELVPKRQPDDIFDPA